MGKAKKTKQKPIDVFFLSVTILILVSVSVLAITNFVRTNVDCKELTKKSQLLIQKNKYQEAYNSLAPHQKTCGGKTNKNDSTDSKIQKLTFHSQFAVAAYGINKIGSAEAEADKGFAIIKTLNNSEKSLVPKSVASDMVFIKAGIY